MADTQIVKLYPTDAETSSIHKWAMTATEAQEITVLKKMTKADIALVALRGFELGIGMGHALDSIYVVNGRTSMSAELMRERAIGAGYRIEIASEDAEQCAVAIWHISDPDYRHEETFLMEDARKAGLAGKDNWKKYPKQMMRARATANAVRWFAPQALAGCVERNEAEDIPEASFEPRVLSAEEVQDAEQQGRDFVEAHTTLDMDTVDEINAEMMQIIEDAKLDAASKKKLAKSWADWKLKTFGVNEMGQIPASGEAEVRRWVRRLGEKLGVAPEAPEAAVSVAEVEETPTPAEPVADAPEAEDDVQDGDFEDEQPTEEPGAEEADTGVGHNTDAWSESKVPVGEFSRWLASRYDPDGQAALLEEMDIGKDHISKLTAAERFQVFEYVLRQTPEQGDLFGEEEEG